MFKYRLLVLVTVLFVFLSTARSEDRRYNLGLEYLTEIQTDFGRKINWANLLYLEGQFKPWRNGELSLQTISVWKTRKNSILNDLQTFSNIEESNMALNIFLLGYTQSFSWGSLFGGIRNVNCDYFIGDYTSLFTNSSCGIFPTLSANLSIANYPISAIGVHGEFQLSKVLTLRSSLYNGVAGKLFSKDEPFFAVRPKKDGIVNLTELSYSSSSNNYALYNIGSLISTNKSVYHMDDQLDAMKRTKINYALWGSVEQSVYQIESKSIGVLAQGSFAPYGRNDCHYYYGVGVLLNEIIPTRNGNRLGMFFNNATFDGIREYSMELTWECQIGTHFTLQPAVHCVKTGSSTKMAALFRLGYNL